MENIKAPIGHYVCVITGRKNFHYKASPLPAGLKLVNKYFNLPHASYIS